jgi:UPF0755 protein
MKKNLFLIVCGLAVAFCIYLGVQLLGPLPVGNKNIEVEIPKGTSFRQAVEIFVENGVLRDRNFFLAVGRISGIDRKIRAGFYSIYPSMTTLGLMRVLRKGQIIEYEVTVVEGDSLLEVSRKLAHFGIVGMDDFMKLCGSRQFLESLKIDAPSVEGYLFPDTYRIPKGMAAREAVAMMIQRMKEKFTPELNVKAETLGLSEREVLTIASIIEKEAATDEERPIISAVYHNRLKKKIPLQADPTAIYGVKSFREKITYTDLRRDTPYNTYRIKGLPPGPIANPGIKSIHAALHPADVPYIFFVSNNDGTHVFSSTWEEHLAAVKAYREKKLSSDVPKEEEPEQEQ